MTSEFVWAWLPGQSEPVVCGQVWEVGGSHAFRYGRSYLERPEAIALFGIPLGDDVISPPAGMRLHGALRDGLPDAWGQHVILNRLTGRSGQHADTEELSDVTYMRESASDRFGAIDFQDSPEQYLARQEDATLDDLADAAAALEEGRPLPPGLEAALTHGTSVGGARPKATLVDAQGDGWIAKFSSTSDRGNPVVRHEALALDLASQCGIDVVEHRLTTAAGRDALLVRRFDRGPAGTRIMAVSGLTMLGLWETAGRYATYPALLDALRANGAAPEAVGREFFTRIAVNMALGNSDDHARNHAALWDGESLRLSPAYDIDPCRSPGWDSNQAIAYGRSGERVSDLGALIKQASVYKLGHNEARNIVDRVIGAVESGWDNAVDRAQLTKHQGQLLRGSRVLHPSTMEDLPRTVGGADIPASGDAVWVGPHLRNGRSVAGHWRKRPAR